jgi:hypothetical protein
MKLSTRIARAAAVTTLAVSGSIAVAPAVSATGHGPGDITNPTECTHGCGGGGGFQGPDDFKAPEAGPADPTPEPDADRPVVVVQPNFTG